MNRLTDFSSALEALFSDGYVILPNLVSDETVRQINHDLTPWFEVTPRCQGNFYGWRTTRFGSVLSKSRASWEMIMHPTILSIMNEVLLPSCDVYQLNLTQGIRIHPGERRQVPHRDQEMFPMPSYPYEILVNVMWSLSDYTAENGATQVWPGRHTSPPDRMADPAEAIAAEMPAGSALIYLGSVTHCGGANKTGEDRVGIITSYCLGWLRQYENQYLAYPLEVVQSFPQELQRLIGYQLHRPNLGGYENCDPRVVLEKSRSPLPATDALPPHLADQLNEYLRQVA